MECGVVIVAAGRGERLGRPQRKAMVTLAGRPILFHALERFRDVDLVREVVLVVHDDFRAQLEEPESRAFLDSCRVSRLVRGGERRQDSVGNGLRAISNELEAVMVHDAARPFCSPGLLRRLLRALDAAAGAVPVIPVSSTVKRVEPGGRILRTESREQLRLAQTPQAARRAALVEALALADAEGRDVTDEAQALEQAGHAVLAVEDSRWNFKITTPEDLELAELVLAARLWEPKP